MTTRATFTAASAALDGQPSSRMITATLVTYGEAGSASIGSTVFEPGSISVPADPKRVKYLREHDRDIALGYAVAFEQRDDSIVGSFHLPPVDKDADPAWAATVDRALTEAANGTRDSVSVGVDLIRYDVDTAGTVHVYESVLREVSQVAVPAFIGSTITSVTASRQENPIMGTTTQDTATAAADPVELTASMKQTIEAAIADAFKGMASQVEVSTGHQAAGTDGAQPLTATAGPNLAEFCGKLADARKAGQSLTAALSDITPANITDANVVTPLNAPTYLRELWESTGIYRPMFDAFGPARPLTWHTLIAWVWETRPQMADYAGNKAAVPSGPMKLAPVEVGIERSAGAHDFDRIFWDFGDAGVIQAYLEAMSESYQEISNYKVARYLAGATPATGDTVPGDGDGYFEAFLPGVVASVIEILRHRGRPSVCVIDPSVLGPIFDIRAQDAPAFFTAKFNLTAPDGSDVGGVKMVVDTLRNDADAGFTGTDVLVADPTAVRLWEKNPPVRVEAANIPNGGIDLGVFGYHAHRIVHHGRIRKFTIGTDPTPGV